MLGLSPVWSLGWPRCNGKAAGEGTEANRAVLQEVGLQRLPNSQQSHSGCMMRPEVETQQSGVIHTY